MIHLGDNISIPNSHWNDILLSKNAGQFVRRLSRSLWSPREMSLRYNKYIPNHRYATVLENDNRIELSPKKKKVIECKYLN